MAAEGRSLRSRTITTTSTSMEAENAVQPVAVERRRLRDEARKAKKLSPRKKLTALQIATREARSEAHTLWPNILTGSQHPPEPVKIVPDTVEPWADILPDDSQGAPSAHVSAAELVQALDKLPSFGLEGGADSSSDECNSDDEDDDRVSDDQNEFVSSPELEDNTAKPPPPPVNIGETQPPVLEVSSESEQEDMDDIPGDASGNPKVGRQLVDKDHVKVLVQVYQKAMAAFTKSKKGVAPSQLIPSKVWQQVYKAYKIAFPSSTFKEDSLKDHLRQSLKDMAASKESGVPEGADPTEDEELMERLMACDSWKARNILQTRMDAMQTVTGQKSTGPSNKSTPSGSSTTSGQTSSVAPPRPLSPIGSIDVRKIMKPPTKSQNLKDCREDMSAMLGEFKAMSEDRRADSNRKRQLADGKAALHEAKRQESEERRNTLAEQRGALAEKAKMSRINLIKEQKALGLITEDEFNEKCRAVFGL